jgi:hypothetical protein
MEVTVLALILTLAACNNLTGSDKDTLSGETIPQGMGLARIRLNADEDTRKIRTALPGVGGYYFSLTFTAPGKTSVERELSGGMSVTVVLEPVVWTLVVKGYADSARTNLKVTGRTSVPITEGTASSFEVYLTPDFSSGGTGSLSYSIGLPVEVSRAFFALYPLSALSTSREINISTSAGKSATGSLTDLPQGSYRAVIDLYDNTNNKAAIWTGAVHIYDGLSTPLVHMFTAASFADCDPLVTAGTNTLAAKLDTALASSSGAYTIALDGTEGDLNSFAFKTLSITGGKNIIVTIKGNGEIIQLGSNGKLFTLEAVSGSSLKLVLQDVTLRGLNDFSSSYALVQVERGGTLEMKAGSLITDHYSGYNSLGGGVYVNGGTFTMSGGTVSGNISRSVVNYGQKSYGGGVYVDTGTFSMSGGAISGNRTESGYDDSHGGGVYVGDGTFSMSGGAVSSNTSSGGQKSYGGGVYVFNGTFTISGGSVNGNTSGSTTLGLDGGSAYGGGVYVDAGTFSISGGAVSGNGALSEDGHSSRGGGVYVGDGIFTMSGGTVSGNISSGSLLSYVYPSDGFGASYGGGVYVEGGTFTISDGTVSDNTAVPPDYFSESSTYGGGVYVGNGTFIMNGGAVSGNTATPSSSSAVGSRLAARGGGVYVSGGIFTMGGGAVNGNTASAHASAYGGGVYINDGTFTMSEGAVSGNTASASSDAYGGGVYISDGTFSKGGGAVNGNTASSSSYSAYGGGVYVSGENFSMDGGTVNGNTVSSASFYASGGGVYIRGGTFSMSDGSVSGNTAAALSYYADGGGVSVFVGTFSMSGGLVSDNTVSSSSSSSYYADGGGVSVFGTFSMSGGLVSGNTVSSSSSYSGEVLVDRNGIFKMSGNAQPGRVLLCSSRFITISGPLNGGVVPIDLRVTSLTSWTTPVLVLDSSYNSGDLASLKAHFTLRNAKMTESPYTETPITGYVIDDNGYFVAE